MDVLVWQSRPQEALWMLHEMDGLISEEVVQHRLSPDHRYGPKIA